MTRVALLLALLALPAVAGGGPETTLLVVNKASPLSRRVANEYAKLRDIPPSHVFHLGGVPHLGVVKLDAFLETMWTPIRAYMESEGIADQIELIAWSADFPYAVDFSARRGGGRNQAFGRHASLTGLVYLMHLVEDEDEFWNAARPVNSYFCLGTRRGAGRAMTKAEFALLNRAERAAGRKAYGEAAKAYGKLLGTFGHVDRHWYNYACALALAKRPDDALAALRKAVDCGWRGKGHTLADPDLKSVRERPEFKEIVARMAQIATKPARGFARTDGHLMSVQLAYTGRHGNSLPEVLAYLRSAAKSDGVRPTGTVYICKNSNVRSKAREQFFATTMQQLESLGRKVELIDNAVLPNGKADVFGAVVGAAGFSWAKSKATMQPGAISEHLTSFGAHFGTPSQTKISEFLRHGAAGSSGTVQEPLALWQKFPLPFIHVYYAQGMSLAEVFHYTVFNPYQLMIAGDGLARPFAEFVDVKATAKGGEGVLRIETDADELWVDGRRVDGFEIDTTKLDDGWHDVRAVKFSQGEIKTRSYKKLAVTVDNHDRKVEVEIKGNEIRIDAPGAKAFTLREGSLVVAQSTDGTLTLDKLVPGPVTLHARVEFGDGTVLRCEPIALDIPAPKLVAPVETVPTLPGLRGHWVDDAGKQHPVIVVNLGDRHSGPRLMDQLPAKDVKEVVLEGCFEAKASGQYRLAAHGAGTFEFGQLDRPCAAGWHPFALTFTPRGRPNLEMNLGGDQVLAPLVLRHHADPAPKKAPKVDVKADETMLVWKRVVKDVTSITIFPPNREAVLPAEWTVETNTGLGKYKPVKELQVLVAPGMTRNPKKKLPPQYVQLRFKKVRAKKIRLRPKTPTATGRVLVGLERR